MQVGLGPGLMSGGSSAVEQWSVKCLCAAIHWSGVQISLPGYSFFNFPFFFFFLSPAPVRNLTPGWVQEPQTSADQVIKIFESNLGIEHLTFGSDA